MIMASTKKSEFPRITFSLGSIPNCCGIIELGEFKESTGSRDWFNNRYEPGEFFDTEEEQFKDFNDTFDAELASYIKHGNCEGGRYLLIASLVTKYGKTNRGQFPILQKWFEEKGWKVNVSFKNDNTGNVVTMYQKLLSNKAIRQLCKEKEVEYGGDLSSW
jgi:hypothetical protein